MLKPLEQWFCDVCSSLIVTPIDGYVIWNEDEEFRGHSFKIIHQSRCDNGKFPNSSPVTDFLGADGINKLLSMISLGPIALGRGVSSERMIRDIDEYVDFFRRMQTPYYEEARTHFTEGDFLHNFGDANELYPYRVHILKGIVEEYGTDE